MTEPDIHSFEDDRIPMSLAASAVDARRIEVECDCEAEVSAAAALDEHHDHPCGYGSAVLDAVWAVGGVERRGSLG